MDRYEIAAFIHDARTVSSDPQLEHEMLNWLLVHTHGAAGKFVDEYYHSEDFAHNQIQDRGETNDQCADRFDSAGHSRELSGAPNLSPSDLPRCF